MSIPSRLRNNDINFCLVEKPIRGDAQSGKRPFQENWPNLNVKWDNENLKTWIGQGGNYGVIGGGAKNLIIIDFDDKVVQEEVVEKLPETFTVKTGGGLFHKYFFTNGGKSFKILDEQGRTLADIQSEGKQVVGPGSLHYSGNNYSIEDNSPIATITYEKIKELLMPYHKYIKGQKNVPAQKAKEFTGIDDFQEDLFGSVTLESLLEEFGVDISKNPSNCPFHDSKGGKCLGWDDDTAHCFHCDGAWNKMSWIKDNKECDAKEAIEWLAEREGRTEELLESREKWKVDKIHEEIREMEKTIQGKDDKEVEDFKEREINWTDEDISWDDMKEDVRKIIKGKGSMFLVCSKNDEIKGKPQLIHTTRKKITLVRLTEKEKGRKGQEELVQKIKFLDESSDKRTDGVILESWAKDFWTYRVIDNSIEYYLLSEKELPISGCIIKGMKMEVTDMAEMNQSLRVKSVSNLFFVHSFEPSVKVLTKEEIINLVKGKNITEQYWTDYLDLHPIGTMNRFPQSTNMIRSIQLLSGKKHGWPLHVGIMGPAGTRKSMGYIETIAHKFDENPSIVEGANSRIKGLSPSFKEKPANIGYLAKCERMGWIDELGKMVEFESNRHDAQVNNVLGELNFLLDHKKRTVGSGNDNECVVQAGAKFLFATNPVRKMKSIESHVGTIDPTTMSRIFWWIQNEEEQKLVMSDSGVVKPRKDDLFRLISGVDFRLIPRYPCLNEEKQKSPPHIQTGSMRVSTNTKNKNTILCVCECGGDLIGIPSYKREIPRLNEIFSKKPCLEVDDFLTLFDTLNSFLCDIDDDEIHKMHELVLALSRGKMREIWKPRGPHHIELLIDGAVKHRCLFKDYDATFKVKQEDYDLVEKLLVEMVDRWNTDMSIGGSL